MGVRGSRFRVWPLQRGALIKRAAGEVSSSLLLLNGSWDFVSRLKLGL